MITRRTTCPLDCPDSCALDVSIEDGRVTEIAGASDNGITNGFVCSKVAGFGSRLTHPERLTAPLRRVGRKGGLDFEAISWTEAIDDITNRFRQISQEFGGEAILPFHYGGSNGLLTDGFIDRLFFAKLGASRLDKTICAVPTTQVAVGMYGKMPGVAFDDYVHAKSILVWGANPKASSIHHVPFLKEAKKRGAFITTIDPRRNFSANEVDMHLAIRPGTDVVLALAMIRWWREQGFWDEGFLLQHVINLDAIREASEGWSLEAAARITGLETQSIEIVAQRFAESTPAVIRCGWGQERNRNGGQATAAILAIPALLGKFGVRGGGYTMSNSGAVRSHVDDALGGVEWETRRINMTQLGKVLSEVDDPPIKALFVYNANPVVTVPNQGLVINELRRDDLFTVVFDQVMTDSATYADIVLPATTFLEHTDIRVGYGTFGVGGVAPVVQSVGASRPNAEVFAELGRAMGFTEAPFFWKPEEYVDRVVEHVKVGGQAAQSNRLKQGEIQHVDFPGSGPVQFESVFPMTQDKKVDLAPSILGPNPYEYIPVPNEEAFALVSPSSSRLITSTFGESNLATLRVAVNTDDALRLGIRDGADVRVYNPLGEVHCVAQVTDRIRSGVLSMSKGAWRRSSRNGMTSTALCPDHVNIVGEAACFNDARVNIAPL